MTVAPWVMDWISTAAGSYTIQAVATDDKGATSQSQVITVEAIASAGGKCSGATNYIAGSSYATGQNVVNNGELYQCLVGGWCSSDSAWLMSLALDSTGKMLEWTGCLCDSTKY
ncbi:chitinase [Vibrio variabilis]|uniref:Chitinase n=1 Tax=Vibrio variabilis TaxID=990271 RepID=A0ABQ0JKF0_9VIBR|nr:chitinase [Vibrio variabilis]